MTQPADAPWGPGRGSLAFQLGLSTFGILALELALIRWMSGQVRIVAYFSNLLLLMAFLGMGLGVALGRRKPGLVHALLPALAVFAAVLTFAEPLGLMHMRFPDPTISLWNGEAETGPLAFAGATLVVVACFWSVAGLFVLAGTPVGWLFDQLPPLKAYTADLAGSLLGVLATTALSALGTPPAAWLALGALPFAFLSRKPLALVGAVAALALAGYSAKGAIFSPYNRIDLDEGERAAGSKASDWWVSVNRDYHQRMLALSNKALAGEKPDSKRRFTRQVYDLPFAMHGPGERALVVGAGTGNDVAAALRNGFQQVVSVDIDGRLIQLGRDLHPDQPYSDPRALPVVNDARAYFAQNPDERFDVICYGLLDSHAMFSAMSTLRLDNYVYTLEGLRAAWAHVKDDGLLSVSFSVYAGPWIQARLYRLVKEATGREPVVVGHGYNVGATFLVGRTLDPSRVPAELNKNPLDTSNLPDVRIPTDDWPFLYLRPGSVPYAYLAVLSVLLLTAAFAVRRAWGPGLFGARRFDLPLFFMGAAFMLLETRLVTELSLLFGSTWVVNACVFAGVLVMVLLANLFVLRRPIARLEPLFLLLGVSLVVTSAMGPAALAALPLTTRALVAAVLFALPVAFAGVIFSTLLQRAAEPAGALGANLLGSMLGGTIEYSSMYLGLKAMVGFVLFFYLCAYLAERLRGAPAPAPAPAVGG